MAVMIGYDVTFGMADGFLGEGNDGSAGRIGNVQAAKAVQYAADYIYRQHEQSHDAAQTARQSKAEV
ncbi:MAG: hypothetical protein AB7I42_27775 [Bradyrhizobium sp.]|jgi:hypothetical protein|uniref:hypothetical protein n=1 Tax=Bradyrhizobium sp. TaxID=376 RepID=UPI003D0BD20B